MSIPAFPLKKNAIAAEQLPSLQARMAAFIGNMDGFAAPVRIVDAANQAGQPVADGKTIHIKLEKTDYEAGDMLADLIGSVEEQRLSVRIWNKNEKAHSQSLRVNWNIMRPTAGQRTSLLDAVLRELTANVRGQIASNSSDQALSPALTHELREALYRVSRFWGGEAAQFGAIKAKLVWQALIGLLGSSTSSASSLRVVDPCAGWGERCIGAMLTPQIGEYVGFDPNLAMHANYVAIRDLCSGTRELLGWTPCQARFFEDATPISAKSYNVVEPGSMDIAFTSPPFWDKELYNVDAAAWPWKTLEGWINGFYKPMLLWMWERIRVGGILAIHIDNYSNVELVRPLQRFMSGETSWGQSTPIPPSFRESRSVPKIVGAEVQPTIYLIGSSGVPRPVWVWKKVLPA